VSGGGDSITTYRWDFGDGTVIEDGSATETHTYTADGTYTITLTVTNDSLNTDTVATTVFVGNMQPTAAFTLSPEVPDVNEAVSFDATASSDPDGSIVRYDWDFGDGTVLYDGGATPSHTYTTDGTYQVVLTVTDDFGDTAQATTPVTAIDPNGGASQSWDFETGSGDRSFAELGWEAYASPRDNTSVTDHSSTGAFPAVIQEDNSIGGASLALMDADASGNSLSAQFYAGVPVSVPIADVLSFGFKHISNTGSSDGSKFLRIVIQIDGANWYIAETAVPESPSSVSTSTLLFDGARWIAWEDPTDGFGNIAGFATSGGATLTTGTITRVGILMASNRTEDYAKFDDVELLVDSPAPPPELQINMQGGIPGIHLLSESGYLYRMRGTDTLGTDPATWPVIGEAVSGDGSELIFLMEDPATLGPNARRFYVIERSAE
jgi:PKD repeat protein